MFSIKNRLASYPFILHVILRPIKYLILIYIFIFILAALLDFMTFSLSEKKYIYPDRYLSILINSLIISPFFETTILYLFYQIIVNNKIKIINDKFLFVILSTTIAWIAHGMSFTSIFPAIMFFLDAIFLVRSKNKNVKDVYVFSGTFFLHVLYNIPYVIRIYN